MKLRIRGNSIRLRLSQKEVKSAAAGEVVSERTQFGEGNFLEYTLQLSKSVNAISTSLHGSKIEVLLPWRLAEAWANSSQVSLEGSQAGLSILVEKDFLCLKPRMHAEDESDLFPNPNLAHGNCGHP